MNALGIRRRPAHLPELQACAAVGQGRLTAVYDQCFRRHGYHAAQILLTRDDFNDRSRYLNASNTVHAILDYGAVPVINENDTISVEEIGFGENDGLAALVANLVSADMLILLTVVDGLYENPDAPVESRRVIPLVPKVTDEIRALANGSRSRGGRGGMASKLEAARVATDAGALALIANALQARVLERIFDGEELGTLFLPAKGRRMTRRKSWIRFGSRPKGTLVVDAGARARARRGRPEPAAFGHRPRGGRVRRGRPGRRLRRDGRRVRARPGQLRRRGHAQNHGPQNRRHPRPLRRPRVRRGDSPRPPGPERVERIAECRLPTAELCRME